MADIMHHADGGVDIAALRDALAGPGMDTRQWLSFAIVEPEGGQAAQVVEFTPDLGPLVNVTLQPSGISVRCRVAGHVAGNMEAEYYPFVQGDEVLVAIPEGDERAGCTIIGRLNNGLDLWPGGIAGQDATQNNLAFRRIRAPYVLEFAESYLMRSPATGAFLSMTQDGQVTISNADHAFLSLTPDFIGIQNGDASLIVQLNNHSQGVVLQASPPLAPPTDGSTPIVGTTTLTISENSTLLSDGTFTMNVAGQYGIEHAASAEGVANVVYNVLVAVWPPFIVAMEALVAPTPGSKLIPPGTLEAVFSAAAMALAMNTGLATAAGFDITPFAAAIAAALAAKVPGDVTGTLPSVGSPGILIG